MGKRSSFKRIPKDKYRTFDPRAGAALKKHLSEGMTFWEPCADQLDLVNQIEALGPRCVVATDIQPGCEQVFRLDALTATREDVDSTGVSHIITNPPWTRSILHKMIAHFAAIRPTWLLFDANWVWTKQASQFWPMLVRVVPVGRLQFIPNTTMSGKDDCAWFLFDTRHTGCVEICERAA